MIPGSFEYFSPSTIEEAVSLLSRYRDDCKILSGGQSLIPLMKLRLAQPAYLIDLGGIPGMTYIREEGEKIAIGALTPYSQVETSQVLQKKCGLLPKTAAVVGDVQVRNLGTIGGSLAHADPAGDMPAAVLALDGDIKAVGPEGERWIPSGEFFLGMLTTVLSPDEIVTEVRVPVLNGWKTAYLKAAQRSSGFATAGIAVALKPGTDGRCEDIALAVTGISDFPFRARASEAALRGKMLEPGLIAEAVQQIGEGLDIISDLQGSAEYRLHLARVYTCRAIETAG